MLGPALYISFGYIALATTIYHLSTPAGLRALFGYFVLTGLCLFPTLTLLGLIYVAVPAVWLIARRRRWSQGNAAAAMLGAVVVCFVVALLAFIPKWQHVQQLDHQYPSVPVADLLPYELQPSFTPPGKVRERSVANQSRINDRVRDRRSYDRERVLYSIERVHDGFLRAFEAQSGFGGVRMRRLSLDATPLELPPPQPIPQPSPRPDSTSAGEVATAEPVAEDSGIEEFNQTQVIEFANAEGFGEVGRDHRGPGSPNGSRVRGFQSHGFRTLPTGSVGDGWQLARLELVSLLKHDPPAVYLSEHLPRMEELASETAPTRPLNAFETTALPQLLEGQNIVAETQGNRLRVLGGVQAAHVCTQCHNVQAGHLLGAFTYQFRRDAPAGPVQKRPLL